MRAQRLGDAELLAQLLTGDTHCVLKQGMVRPLSGKEPVLRLAPSPVKAQQIEKLGRQHDLARELALALADMNDHPLAVDVGDLQVESFLTAKSGAVVHG